MFDNTAASGKELARMILAIHGALYNNATFEFDMHGVIASNGLYLEISTGNAGAAVSVEFNLR